MTKGALYRHGGRQNEFHLEIRKDALESSNVSLVAGARDKINTILEILKFEGFTDNTDGCRVRIVLFLNIRQTQVSSLTRTKFVTVSE